MAEEPKESPAFQQMALNVNKIQQQMDQMRDMFLTAMANRAPVNPAPVPFPVANAPPAVYSLLVPPVQSFRISFYRGRAFTKMEKAPREFDPLPVPQSIFLPKLVAAGLITPVPFKVTPNPLSKTYDPNVRFDYHMGGTGHETDRCLPLTKSKTSLIKVFGVQPAKQSGDRKPAGSVLHR